MIMGWESLDSHRELPTNTSVGVVSNEYMLFGGVPFVQDTVAMPPRFADQSRDPPSFRFLTVERLEVALLSELPVES
jgi:hypothetical protein